MVDIRSALADMATQIRTCRNGDGLTLQQLAARSHVAASTIHKIEAQQMIPTISVLLKIAKGLERRPEELIRDTLTNEAEDVTSLEITSNGIDSAGGEAEASPWRLGDLDGRLGSTDHPTRVVQ
jgi:transcriptional regulator with XRE-family HTH domain